MAWPPVTPTDKQNATPQVTVHHQDHNMLAQGLNEIVARVQDDIACRKQSTDGGSIPHATWTYCSTGQTVAWTYGDIRGDASSIISDSGGFFLLIGTVFWGGSDGTGRRMLGFSESTTATPAIGHYAATAGTTQGQVQVVSVVMHKPADATWTRFCLWAYQDSGETVTLSIREAVVIRLTPEYITPPLPMEE